MKTKLTSLILSVVLIVCALSTVFVVSAANNDNGSFVLSFNGPKYYIPGEKITVAAILKNVTACDGLSIIKFELTYDTDCLELDVGKDTNGALDFQTKLPGGKWENLSTVNNGKIIVQYGNATDDTLAATKDASVVIYFTFNVKQTVTAKQTIGIVDGSLKAYGPDLTPINGVAKSFSVTANPAEHLKGDIDEDGRVTSGDAIYLLRHTMFASYYLIYQNGDIDHNGKIQSGDAIYLLRHTLFSDAYPLD